MLVILFNRDPPSTLSFACRRSLRIRACSAAEDGDATVDVTGESISVELAWLGRGDEQIAARCNVGWKRWLDGDVRCFLGLVYPLALKVRCYLLHCTQPQVCATYSACR